MAAATHRLLATGNAIAHLPLRLRNRWRLRPLEVHERDYLILNDAAHDWSLLQYYIAPEDQRRQLADVGFELLVCLDLGGRPIGPGYAAEDQTELHYVARPASQPPRPDR